MNNTGCDFCRSAHFERFGTMMTRVGDHPLGIVLSSDRYFPGQVGDRFRYCPRCGAPLKEHNMTFEFVLASCLKNGKDVRRHDWPHGLYVTMCEREGLDNNKVKCIFLAHIDDSKLTPWDPKHEDLFAEDWEEV